MPLSTHDTPPSTTYYPTPTSDHKLPAFGMSYQEVTNTLKGGADTPMVYEGGDEDSSQFSMSPREEHDQDSEMCLRIFETWPQTKQTEYVEQLIARMSFHQHEHIYSILMPMLQRDFITVLPSEWLGVAEGRGGGRQEEAVPQHQILTRRGLNQHQKFWCMFWPHLDLERRVLLCPLVFPNYTCLNMPESGPFVCVVVSLKCTECL